MHPRARDSPGNATLRGHCRNNLLAEIMPVIPLTELRAHLHLPAAGALADRWMRHRQRYCGTLDLCRPCQGVRYLLVHDRYSRSDGHRRITFRRLRSRGERPCLITTRRPFPPSSSASSRASRQTPCRQRPNGFRLPRHLEIAPGLRLKAIASNTKRDHAVGTRRTAAPGVPRPS